MGLDNGFVLHITNKERFGKLPNWINNVIDFPVEKMNQVEYWRIELLYWRKCYNLRKEIYECLRGFNFPEDTDLELCRVSLDQFEKIINHLMYNCYDFDWWQENDDSIWKWCDVQPKILEDGSESTLMKTQEGVCDNFWFHMAYANRWLEFLRNKPEDSYYIEWYDSY